MKSGANALTHVHPDSVFSLEATCVPFLPSSLLRKDQAFELQKFCKHVFCWVHINFSVHATFKLKVLLICIYHGKPLQPKQINYCDIWKSHNSSFLEARSLTWAALLCQTQCQSRRCPEERMTQERLEHGSNELSFLGVMNLYQHLWFQLHDIDLKRVSGFMEVCNKRQVFWTSKLFWQFCELKKTRYPKLRNLALFYVREEVRVWVHVPICISAIWGQYPVFSHPQLPCCSAQGVAASASDGCHIPQVFFFLSAPRAHTGKLISQMWHSSLLIWQEILHFSVATLGGQGPKEETETQRVRPKHLSLSPGPQPQSQHFPCPQLFLLHAWIPTHFPVRVFLLTYGGSEGGW